MTGLMFWQLPIQTMLESFLILFFASVCNILRPNMETSGAILELVLAYVFLFISVAFLFVSAIFMYIWHDNLGEQQTEIRYGPLYEELDLSKDKKMAIVAFRSSFLLRRMLIIFALLCTDKLFFQL